MVSLTEQDDFDRLRDAIERVRNQEKDVMRARDVLTKEQKELNARQETLQKIRASFLRSYPEMKDVAMMAERVEE